MRRILSACLLQTMRFDTTSGVNPEKELELFCNKLDKKDIKYSVEDRIKEPDGSVVIKIRKQYNSYKSDGYFD